MKKYTFVEHTADAGIKAYGKSLEELFVNAALATFATVVELDSIDENMSMEINVEADTLEELIVEWLRELLFQQEVEEIFFNRVKIQEITETNVSAIAYGEPIDLEKHEFNTEIKNVTYHKLSVKKIEDGTWQAQVIFDL